MVGAVRGIDPRPASTSTTPSATSTPQHSATVEREQIFSGNARRVFPRLERALAAQGRA
jgi:4-oxalmesaconate hydratase